MDPTPRRTQRLGAYGVVLRRDDRGVEHLLLTRISPVGYPARWWGLPGGGVDHGESPDDTVVRELHEETGLRVVSRRLVEVHDVHVVEQGRGDRWEDFHGVHVVYAVDVEGGGLPTPTVVEVGGTTDEARWVPTADLRDAPPGRLLAVVEHVLGRLDAYRSPVSSGPASSGAASSGAAPSDAASSGSIGFSAPGPADPSGV